MQRPRGGKEHSVFLDLKGDAQRRGGVVLEEAGEAGQSLTR